MTSLLHRSASTGGIDRESVLDDVLEEVANRLQAGDPVDRAAIVAKYPEHAESLLRLLPAVEVMAEFGVSASRLAARGAPPGVGPLETGLGELGDFRILREIGRGGMGVVYEAEQISLGRRVALKVLPFAAALDSHQLQRFKTEAQAAAQLHHTNIVPVYCVGCERGVHYFAMQYIEGQTLAQAIADRRQMEELPPLPARGGSPSAAFAEAEGPSLESRLQAESGPAKAGTATHQLPAPGASPDAARAETEVLSLESRLQAESGPAKAGTPTQLRCGSPDPAETTGRRSPVAIDNPTKRNANGSATPSPSSRTREYVRTVAALGIQAAEALDHAHKVGIVHRDIKPANLLLDVQGNLWITDFGLARLQDDTGLTITGDLLGTLRYMSPEQALAKRGYLDHRTDIYSLGATLYELATLRLAIDGQNRQEVLRKIGQEEPTPPRGLNPSIPRELETILLKAMSKEPVSRYATAQELAADLRRFLEDKPIRAKRPTLVERIAKWARRHRAAVMAAVGILIVAAAGLGTSTVLIARSRSEALRQRDRARRAVDEMYTQVAQKWLSQQPQLEPLQREFLLRALAFYEDFARERGSDPNAEHAAARAHRNAGNILQRLGEHAQAEINYRRAVEIEEVIVAGSPGLPEYRKELADDYASLAFQFRRTGRLEESERNYSRSLALREALVAKFPKKPDYRLDVALGYNEQGYTLRERGRFEDARQSVRRALDFLDALVSEFPTEYRYRKHLGDVYSHAGVLSYQAGRSADAEAAWRRAIETKDALAGEAPAMAKDPQLRASLALDHTDLGAILLAVPDRLVDAERVLRRALNLGESLIDEFPKVPEYRRYLAMSYGNLGILLLSAKGRQTEAERAVRSAIQALEVLVSQSPNMPEYQSNLGASLDSLGKLQNDRGELTTGLVSFQSAVEHQRAAVRANPRNPTYRQYLRNHYWGVAAVSEKQGDHARAAEAAEESAKAAPSLAEVAVICAGNLVRCQQLAESDSKLSPAERQAKVRDYADRAAALLRGGIEAAADDPQALNGLAWSLATCTENRLRDPARAAELAKKALKKAPNAGAIWNTLGVAHYRGGARDEAIQALSRSMELTSGGFPGDWFFLAMAHWQRGEKDQARKWYEQSVQWIDKNKSNDDELNRFRAEAAALLGVTERPTSTERKEEKAPKKSKP